MSFGSCAAIVAVEMAEGVRIVWDMPGIDPHTLALDQPLEAYIESRGDESGLSHFRHSDNGS